MDFERIIYSLPAVLLGLTVHEFCHALVSYKLGDSTARDQGRISLNPLRHIDPIGLIFIVFAGFGWAKPVQFSPAQLSRPRRDKALIAAAGPLSNLVLGILLTLLLRFLFTLDVTENRHLYTRTLYLVFYAASINLGLFVFNMIPIPPLDGSHIVFSGLNLNPETESRIIRIASPVLFIMLIISATTDINILPIGRLVNAIMEIFL